MGRARAILRLARPGNVLFAMVGVLVGALGTFGLGVEWRSVGAAVLAAAFGVAAGNALNDGLDALLDRTAHPSRPIPRGLLGPGDAFRLSALWFLLAVLFTLGTNLLVLLFAAQGIANLLVYEYALKERGLLGNLLVSYNVGMLFVIGALAGGSPPFTYLLDGLAWIADEPRLIVPLTMAALAFTLNLAREILKDAEDAPADAAFRRTFPMAQPHQVRLIATGILWTAVPLSLVPAAFDDFAIAYVLLLVPVWALLLWIPFIPSAGRAQRLVKVAMLVGFVPLLSLGFL